VTLSPLGTSATIWPIVPVPHDTIHDECEAIDEMTATANPSTRRKSVPVMYVVCEVGSDLSALMKKLTNTKLAPR
jgi:hypothetical protein